MAKIIQITKSAAEPVYAQIAGQIRAWILAGELPSGSELATVRSLAGDLGVNLNTVARGYRLLEKDGFVTIESRRRVRVAPSCATADPGAARLLQSRLREVLQRLRRAGLGEDEIQRLVLQELGASRRPDAGTE